MAKIKIMTYQEANNINIKDYLESLGILPVVDKLYYGMYHSPFRQDDTPSFKVAITPPIPFLFKGKYHRKESGKGGKEATSQPGRNP